MDKGIFDYAKYGSIGIAWVLSTVIYTYIGYKGGMWLDQRINSEPLFLVVGLLVAVALSLYSLVAEVISLLGESGNKHSQSGITKEKGNISQQTPRAHKSSGNRKNS